jgi:hypothetical protein
MNAATIIAIVTGILSAVETGAQLAKNLGLGSDAEEALAKIKAEVNAQAAKLLPGSAIALDLAVQLTAANVNRRIESLGESPRCPSSIVPGVPCGAVLKQHASKPIDGSEPTRSYSCDACGWRSA